MGMPEGELKPLEATKAKQIIMSAIQRITTDSSRTSRHVRSTLAVDWLFQGAVNRSELGIELSTKPVNDRDDGERNACGDQAIFDGGRAGLICNESSDRFHTSREPYKLLMSP
jgi:hypothetical protein